GGMPLRIGRRSPGLGSLGRLIIVPNGPFRLIVGEAAEKRAVAPAIVWNAAGSIELDRLERAHERPAQAEAVSDRLVKPLWGDDALLDQSERFGEKRRLQPVQDKAIDLALHMDRRLTDGPIYFTRPLQHLRRGPRSTAQLHDRHEMRRID